MPTDKKIEEQIEKWNNLVRQAHTTYTYCINNVSNYENDVEILKVNVLSSKYQVYKDVAGKYRFRLRAANNKIVAVSQAYESKDGCMNGVMSVQKNCNAHVEDKTTEMEKLSSPKYEVFADVASEFRFNLKAGNGEIIAASEGYETKQGVLQGVEAVTKSCDAEIEDLTVESTEKEVQEFEGLEEVCKEPHSGINDAVLLLNSLPATVDSGSTVTFTGKLTTHDTVEGVSCAEIDIMEKDRSFMRDDLLCSGATNNDGTFAIDWVSKQMDFWDDKIEFYARFKGTKSYRPSKSDVHKMQVLWYARRK